MMGWAEDFAATLRAKHTEYQRRARLEEAAMTQQWIWMPHAAHLCVADRCQFRLVTYIPGRLNRHDGVIVSTVGEYVLRDSRKFEALGYDRLYETMVFKARPCEPDECEACPYSMDEPSEIDFAGYNTARGAYAGHMAMCRKWAEEE